VDSATETKAGQAESQRISLILPMLGPFESLQWACEKQKPPQGRKDFKILETSILARLLIDRSGSKIH
jgi:hypothetical protein